MSTELSELDRFRAEVLTNIALLDIDLRITDERGEMPVVVALDEELISTMLRRVASVGGNATVFSRGGEHVRIASFVNTVDALDPRAGEDMASPNNRPGPTANVGAFLDYLEMQSEGVRISVPLGPNGGGCTEATDVREAVFS